MPNDWSKLPPGAVSAAHPAAAGLFGSDHPGTKHDISVGFRFLAIVGVLTLVTVGVVALTRRVHSARTS